MKILLGTVNMNETRPVTQVFLRTLKKAFDALSVKASEADLFKWELIIDTVVAVNGTENELDELKKEFPFINKWIYSDKALTCARNWNSLIKSGFDNNGNPLYDYYLVLNNDLYFTEKSISNYITCLLQNKDIGWLSFLGNDFKEDELTGIPEIVQVENRFWSIRPQANEVDSPEVLENTILATYAPFGGIEKFADLLQRKYGIKPKPMHQKAFGFGLSKECIKKVGLFDEYGEEAGLHEDCDYGVRMKLADIKTGVAVGAYVHHLSMMTRTKNSYSKEWWVNAREKAFTEKWGYSSKETHLITNENFKPRLDIGSGENPKGPKHYYHIDIDPQFKDVEFLQNVTNLSNFEDGSVSEIFTSNVLEHIFYKDVPPTVYEWSRVLCQGGKIHIRVPNFRWVMEQYVARRWKMSFIPGTDLNAMHVVYGGDHDGAPHMHRAGFDRDTLSELMRDAGIIDIKDVSDPNSWELRLEGIKG
jgi:GT2 family glycosyltransferase